MPLALISPSAVLCFLYSGMQGALISPSAMLCFLYGGMQGGLQELPRAPERTGCCSISET